MAVECTEPGATCFCASTGTGPGCADRIGEAVAGHPGRVVVRTSVGATRVLDMLVGEQLPRIW